MNLQQFQNHMDNGWTGPYEDKKGRIILSKQKKSAGSNGGYWRHEYFEIYKCKYCGKNGIGKKTGKYRALPICCSRYSECFSKHAGIQNSKDKIIHTRENPGIKRGYYYWREQVIDKNGNKISTGDGNKRKDVYLHRVIMEEYLGRPLNQKYNITKNKKDYDIVHHIDMKKLNNNIDNLWLCSVSDHTLAHASYNEVCAELMTNFNKYSGINFNRKTGRYYLINKQKGKNNE